jgi:hypothetical protein
MLMLILLCYCHRKCSAEQHAGVAFLFVSLASSLKLGTHIRTSQCAEKTLGFFWMNCFLVYITTSHEHRADETTTTTIRSVQSSPRRVDLDIFRATSNFTTSLLPPPPPPCISPSSLSLSSYSTSSMRALTGRQTQLMRGRPQIYGSVWRKNGPWITSMLEPLQSSWRW